MRVLPVASPLAALAIALGGCNAVLPDRYAVAGPVTSTLFGWGGGTPEPTTFASRVRVPAGFEATIFAEGLEHARMLRFTPAGDLLVTRPRAGVVTLLEPDRDGDGRSDGSRTLVEGLASPHGIDLHDGHLYVAGGRTVVRFPFDAAAGRTTGPGEIVVEGLPSRGNHWTRTLRFAPDGSMLVTIGSSCNVCVEDDPRRGAMMRFAVDDAGSHDPVGAIFASGLRNAVDFDWHPVTGALFATENGRDFLGDDDPPCELDRIEPGGFYGWPFANGDRVPDPDLGKGHAAEILASIPPVHAFGAHVAPLGITFLRSDRWPATHRHAAVVALHGSWNRSTLVGYRLVSLHGLDDPDGPIVEQDFLWGLERDGDVIGRPVGVVEGPDGALYASDDYAGVVYRIVATGRPDPGSPSPASNDPLDDTRPPS